MIKELNIEKNVTIKKIKEEEIKIVLDFQKEIIDNMEHKEWFVPLTKEEFLTPIRGEDNVYVFIYNNIIIGLLVLTCNISEILKDYELPSTNYMLIDSIMVKEGYRGYGLQRQLLNFAYKRAFDLNMDGLVATIHPDNKYSLNNFLNDNYNILHTLTIHGGTRKIVVKNVEK